MQIEVVVFYLFLFILGAIFGSFVGAMTWRMHEKKDWVRGRSQCEHCGHQLAAIDLIPIISWLSLKGKCRYCHKPIGYQALLIELITGALFVVSVMLLPSALTGQWQQADYLFTSANLWMIAAMICWLGVTVLLVALSVYDWRWLLLPDKLMWPLMGLALVYAGFVHLGVQGGDIVSLVVSILLGWLPISGIYAILYFVSKGRWIGFGDVKYGLVVGMLLPWWGGLGVLFLANLLGSLVMLPSLISRKVKAQQSIAFGPYLIIATIIMVLLGWQVRLLIEPWLGFNL